MFLTYLIPLNKNIRTGEEFKRKSPYFGQSFERTQRLKLRTTHGPEIFSLISQDSQSHKNLKQFLVLALSSGSPNYILLTNGNFQLSLVRTAESCISPWCQLDSCSLAHICISLQVLTEGFTAQMKLTEIILAVFKIALWINCWVTVLEWTTGISDQTTVFIALDDMFFISSAIWGMAIIWQAPSVEKIDVENVTGELCIQLHSRYFSNPN